MKKIIYLIILLITFTCVSVQANTYLPSDDTFIDERLPDTNSGTQPYMIVRSMNLVGFELDTLVKFNLSSLPTGTFINSARLNLYYYHYNDANPSGNPLNVYRITSTWSESTTKWTNRPTYDSTATSTVSGPGSYGWIQWNVRSDVQGFVNGSKTNYGWQIMDASASSNSMIYFRSKEYSDSNYLPYLEVEYGTIYVDANATGDNSGSSWTNAFNYLQDALAATNSNSSILIAQGIYTPDRGGGKTQGDRFATFQLKNNVAIYGGFPTGGATFSQRKPHLYQTILSGDLAGNDVGGLTDPSRNENSYNIVTGTGTNATALLDGFIITAGNANGTQANSCGGGMYSSGGSPTVGDCNFVTNSAQVRGGGMYNYDNSHPIVKNCIFTRNSSDEGGAMANWYYCSPMVSNCIFTKNSNTGNYAAGMQNHDNCNPKVTNCIFSENSGRLGVAMTNDIDCTPTVTNCLFNGNSGQYGGAIINNGSRSTYTNCTVYNNSATVWGGGVLNQQCSPVLTNCILWDNTDESGSGTSAQMYLLAGTGSPIVTFSCIKDSDSNDTSIPFGGAANNNIDDNPLFENAGSGALRLSPASPCIETGSNSAIPTDTADLDNDGNITESTPWDLDSRPRFIDGDCDDTATVDMGAYEFAWIYVGDLDGDCDVDFADFAVIANHWLAGK